MVNAEKRNIDDVNPGADDQDSNDVTGEESSVTTFPNTRKRPLSNSSGRENDGAQPPNV